MNLRNIRYLLLIIFIFTTFLLKSQPPYTIEKLISANKISDLANQRLLILDFWATWCAPCVTATKQLEILQEIKANDVFIVSISDEKQDVINKFLQKKPINLTVVKDFQSNLVNKFNVQKRPYAILLTMSGKVLYSGHPSGITSGMIDSYASRIKPQQKLNFNDLFTETNEISINNNNRVEAGKFIITKTVKAGSTTSMYTEDLTFNYSGPISELLKILLDCSNTQIRLSGVKDYNVLMSCDIEEFNTNKNEILDKLKEQLALNIQIDNKELDAMVLKITDPKKLWDDKQINWGEDSLYKYMVGADRVEADNLTLKQIANILTNITSTIYYYNGNDMKPHDWNFHYLYENLMKEDLKYNFGIEFKREKITLPTYVFMPA